MCTRLSLFDDCYLIMNDIVCMSFVTVKLFKVIVTITLFYCYYLMLKENKKENLLPKN